MHNCSLYGGENIILSNPQVVRPTKGLELAHMVAELMPDPQEYISLAETSPKVARVLPPGADPLPTLTSTKSTHIWQPDMDMGKVNN